MMGTTKTIIPMVNSEHSQSQSQKSYNLKQWAKAGLIFAGTVGAFLTLKATGSFSLITSWFKNSEKTALITDALGTINSFNLVGADESRELAIPLITEQLTKRSSTELFPAVIELSSLDGTNGFKLDGEAEGDLSGFSVSGAGDINGDNIGDLIVGAPGAEPSGSESGRSYVVFGHNGTWSATLALTSLDGTNGFKLDGEAADD
jgi:hypothetical protein